MKPNTRSFFFTTAFQPMERTIDNRAQYYLRRLDAVTQEANPPETPAPPPPRWRVALECLATWTVVAYALLWLAVRWGWIV